MKLVINIPKEAVIAAASMVKMNGGKDYTDIVEESDNICVELSDKDLKPLIGDRDYTTGMVGLAGYGLLCLKDKEMKKNESKSN